MPVDLAVFKIQQATLELRYATAFLLWDRAGTIWRRIASYYPETAPKNVQPNVQTFSLDERTDGAIQVERCSVSTMHAGNLDDFKKMSGIFCEEVLSKLEIKIIDRIGFRVIFERKFNSIEDSINYIDRIVKAKPSKDKYFNIQGRLKEFDYAVRWEDQSRGCLARIKTVQLKLDIETPKEFDELSGVHAQKTVVIVDADMYTLLPVPVGRFNAPAIIEDWFRLMKRDLSEFLDV